MTDGQPVEDGPWLVVGLGNPGAKYAGNRHNVGAMVADELAAGLRERFSSHRSGALVAQARLSPVAGRPGPAVVLAKPTSYMNESGGQVAGLVRFFKVPPHRLLVVHDELDLAEGEVRLKRDGGEGGHNGLRSISKSLGTRDYCRVRVGIGRPPGRMDPADFVLRDFPAGARAEVQLMIVEAADAVRDVLSAGWERAQNVTNTRSRP
ncbi:MAG TPA: aminoacyl-tRNA hydrolase [Kineosporiaceae bacterium]|nr:aminoacyl-tRNA hydrolase [Kineosporiaceae bacterium]